MSRFLCVGSWAFGVVAFFGPTFFDAVFFGLVFFTVVFVFISTPELRSTVLSLFSARRERGRRHDQRFLPIEERRPYMQAAIGCIPERRRESRQSSAHRLLHERGDLCLC